MVHLDHIYYQGDVEVEKVELVRTRRALIASDHLPLVATLRVACRPFAPSSHRAIVIGVLVALR